MARVYLPEVVGGGYGAFWRCRRRYRVVKGGKASKKSSTAAIWFSSLTFGSLFPEAMG